MIKRTQGLSVTGASAEAASLYDQALRAFSLSCGDAVALLDAARESYAGFPSWRIWRKPGCSSWRAIRCWPGTSTR